MLKARRLLKVNIFDKQSSMDNKTELEYQALQALAKAADSPDCFVSLHSEDSVISQANDVNIRMQEGEALPLAGKTFCVKDNLHASGLPTTSNCSGYGHIPAESAPVIQKAQQAGAILIGKNTMDQFATGLNGTRSPEPVCKNSIDESLIPGGSSSGSAVSVAKGICDFSFGSDTGGSGRVPAATNGIYGLKPTPGILSGRGLVYCNRSFDVVPIFGRSIETVVSVFDAVVGSDPLDPYAYLGSMRAVNDNQSRRFAIPEHLDHFGDRQAEETHQKNLNQLEKLGASFKKIDFSPFAEVGAMVFGSALVAERLIDYGDFIENDPSRVVDSVATAINAGRSYSARDLYECQHRLAELKIICHQAIDDCDAIVLPTIPRLYTADEMRADPMALNNVMGTYTYFANPIGFCAIAVDAIAKPNGHPTSLCFAAPAGFDRCILKYASEFRSSFDSD